MTSTEEIHAIVARARREARLTMRISMVLMVASIVGAVMSCAHMFVTP